ncbi:acyl carrier protein [Archangium lipolyticum]|uniref:acyl carrier protein n=1 Tax=Archangium lipolyticum TaxID=2970465 RepID=UPI00214A546E|nr:acyl carrier protein [Archangium lipolyticum]
MRNLTIEQLNQIIYECMGESNVVREDGVDSTFPDLGCDSLAILQVEARLSQDFGVHIPELMFQKMTPREAIAYVNQNAAAHGAAQQGV